jgi:hypothetical protein
MRNILFRISCCIVVGMFLLFPLALVLGLGGGTNLQYEVFRTVNGSNDTQLTATTQKTSPDITTNGIVTAKLPVGSICVILMGTNAADKTTNWTIWAYKSIAGPAEYVAHGTAIFGLTQTGNPNEFYADTIVITDQQWLKLVWVVNDAPETIIAGGGIAKLVFDSCEYKFFRIIMTKGTCATMGAKIANFN